MTMDIKVLGSGSSGNCYRVSDGQTDILLDAGLPLKEISRKLDFHLSQISGVLISHSHGDHAKAVRDLLERGMDVYGSPETFKEIGAESPNTHEIEAMPTKCAVRIGTFNALAFDVHHDVRNYGYLIYSHATDETLVYITDTYYTDFTFPLVTHWMIECNYILDILERNVESGALPRAVAHRIPQSHMSLETVCNLFRANDMRMSKEIYLIHMSDTNGDEARAKRAVQEIAGCPVYVA